MFEVHVEGLAISEVIYLPAIPRVGDYVMVNHDSADEVGFKVTHVVFWDGLEHVTVRAQRVTDVYEEVTRG